MVKMIVRPGLGGFKPVQPGLEPIIGDFYGSPPVDPYNCSLYPDNPMCGGNPFGNRPLAVNLSIVKDACNIGIDFQATIGYIKLPPVQIVYRDPSCQVPNESKKTSYVTGSQPYIPPQTGRGIFICMAEGESYSETFDRYGISLNRYVKKNRCEFISGEYPKGDNYPDSYRASIIFYQDYYEYYRFGYPADYPPNTNFETFDEGTKETYANDLFYINSGNIGTPEFLAPIFVGVVGAAYIFFSRESLLDAMKRLPDFMRSVEHSSESGDAFNSYKSSGKERWRVWELDALPYLPSPPIPPMSCCPNVRENDELLRLILKRIGTPPTVQIFDEDLEREGSQKATKDPRTLFNYAKLGVERTEVTNRLIGIENYPVTVPESMIEPFKEGIFESIFGFFQGDKERKIKSLTEMMAWMAEQDSAVLGQFHQVIEFEQDFDGDGKAQTEKVVLPNVAETLKEVILLLVQLANNEGTKVHALAKLLVEVNNIKANLFHVKNTIVDIQDYLDYPTNTRTVEVPLSVDLTMDEKTEDFKNFFKDSTGKITFEDWDGSNSLHDNIVDLLQMATMMRAILYQRTGQE
jgi:hypothetical protein